MSDFEKNLQAASALGLIRDGEARLLYSIARSLPKESIAAEIGSWMGKSSTAIALGLREINGKLHTIDDHRGIEDNTELPSGEKARHQFLANLEAAGVRDLINHHAASSDDLAPSWNLPLDFLFVDGCHYYENARRDIFNYAPHVKPGGWIAFHDVGMHDTVFRAIQEWMDEKNIRITSTRFSGLILAIRLPKENEPTLCPARTALLRWSIPNACRSLPAKNTPVRRLLCKLRQGIARRIARLLVENE